MTSKPTSLSGPRPSATDRAQERPQERSTGPGPASSLSAASPATASQPRIVPCPTCGGDSIFAPSNPWRPFCGERCRQIDLGHWADESFRVAAPPSTENENDAQQ
jgi:uncharacterized protein